MSKKEIFISLFVAVAVGAFVLVSVHLRDKERERDWERNQAAFTAIDVAGMTRDLLQANRVLPPVSAPNRQDTLIGALERIDRRSESPMRETLTDRPPTDGKVSVTRESDTSAMVCATVLDGGPVRCIYNYAQPDHSGGEPSKVLLPLDIRRAYGQGDTWQQARCAARTIAEAGKDAVAKACGPGAKPTVD